MSKIKAVILYEFGFDNLMRIPMFPYSESASDELRIIGVLGEYL